MMLSRGKITIERTYLLFHKVSLLHNSKLIETKLLFFIIMLKYAKCIPTLSTFAKVK